MEALLPVTKLVPPAMVSLMRPMADLARWESLVRDQVARIRFAINEGVLRVEC